MKTRIGMVGIGLMGQGIASNLLKHGHDLALLEHAGNQPLDPLKAAGAVSYTSAAELAARSDVVNQRVAEGGEIPMASLRELAELVQRSELVAVSQQLLDGPPEFALRRAMELAGLVLAVVATDEREGEREAAK